MSSGERIRAIRHRLKSFVRLQIATGAHQKVLRGAVTLLAVQVIALYFLDYNFFVMVLRTFQLTFVYFTLTSVTLQPLCSTLALLWHVPIIVALVLSKDPAPLAVQFIGRVEVAPLSTRIRSNIFLFLSQLLLVYNHRAFTVVEPILPSQQQPLVSRSAPVSGSSSNSSVADDDVGEDGAVDRIATSEPAPAGSSSSGGGAVRYESRHPRGLESV